MNRICAPPRRRRSIFFSLMAIDFCRREGAGGMDKLDILKKLVLEAGQGELAFQTHAAVTLRVQRALDDPDISVEAIAKLIQAEPVLAAKVVAVANSAAFNSSGRAITDVISAVSRLGFRTVRS